MQIKDVDIKEIKAYAKNPRKNDAAVEAVANSIKEFGWKQPLVIDPTTMEIVAGHTRYKAAKKLGCKTVPCVMADDLTAEQIKAYRLADNKTAELAEWDFDLLGDELGDIEDIDMAEFGFDLSAISDDDEVTEDQVPELDEENETIVKPGDIWQLGEHRLMCGDSTDKATIERLMDGKKADMVFTDPPYGMNAVSKSGVLSERYKTDIMNDDTNEVAIAAFLLCQKMFADVKQVWWGANYYTECLPSAECWIVWDKNNGESDQTDCELGWSNFRSVVRQFTLASEKTNRVHPTQKPIKLIQMILDKFDKDKSYKVILDLFGGSGSTLIACEQVGRRCYMMELDPRYCDVIVKRWEKLTGQTAVKL